MATRWKKQDRNEENLWKCRLNINENSYINLTSIELINKPTNMSETSNTIKNSKMLSSFFLEKPEVYKCNKFGIDELYKFENIKI